MDLVKRLQTMHPEEYDNPMDFAYGAQQAMCEAAEAIEELQRQIDAWVEPERKALIKSLPRWIPVTEEPSLKVGDDGYNGYLVYANGYYEVADYTTDHLDNVLYFHVNGEYEPGVTHYMPLPEPPKEET